MSTTATFFFHVYSESDGHRIPHVSYPVVISPAKQAELAVYQNLLILPAGADAKIKHQCHIFNWH